MASSPLIEIRSVTKRFPGVVALKDVSLRFASRRVARHLRGERGRQKHADEDPGRRHHRLRRGAAHRAARPVRFRGTRDAEAAGVSIIHQELNLVEQLSAAANIFLGREVAGGLGLLDDRTHGAGKRPKLFAAARVRHPTERNSCANSASAISSSSRSPRRCRCKSEHPDHGRADERPDRSEVERLFRVIADLRKQGVTILYISHKMDEIFRLSDRITVLRDGRLVKTLDRDRDQPARDHAPDGRPRDRIGPHLGDGRTPGETLLEVETAVPCRGRAMPDAGGWRTSRSQLRAGEVLGIAGLMGAGRTELLECLFGAAARRRPQGRVLLDGQPVQFTHPSQAKAGGHGDGHRGPQAARVCSRR